jgi:hypothetical protein
MKPASFVCVIFLALVSVAHLLRTIYRVEIVAGGTSIPIWMSVLACLFTAALAGWLWREQRR